ncbi:MAG: hypothetical protein GX430_05555 [Treponema sp.]|nr:hypothetical protein [Treponema sp.]
MDREPAAEGSSDYPPIYPPEPPAGNPPNRRGTQAAGLVAAFVLLLASSCAQTGPAVRPATREAPPAGARPVPPPASKTSEDPIASLPTPARDFLAQLRDHVRRGDLSWAADRADPSFLRAMEGRGRDPYFYTYLFSAGSLAGDAPEYARFETLPVAQVRDMVWEEARIEGPAAVVRGRFILSSGSPVPFALRVLWRLDPPRILGVQP